MVQAGTQFMPTVRITNAERTNLHNSRVVTCHVRCCIYRNSIVKTPIISLHTAVLACGFRFSYSQSSSSLRPSRSSMRPILERFLSAPIIPQRRKIIPHHTPSVCVFRRPGSPIIVCQVNVVLVLRPSWLKAARAASSSLSGRRSRPCGAVTRRHMFEGRRFEEPFNFFAAIYILATHKSRGLRVCRLAAEVVRICTASILLRQKGDASFLLSLAQLIYVVNFIPFSK